MIISHPDRTIADLSADLKSLLNALFFRRFDGNSDGSVADPDKAALVAVITVSSASGQTRHPWRDGCLTLCAPSRQEPSRPSGKVSSTLPAHLH